MKPLDPATLGLLWHAPDTREARLRQVIRERMAASPPPSLDDHIVATYFFALRTIRLSQVIEDTAYYATSGVRHPPPGSLLEACTARGAGIDAFDGTNRIQLVCRTVLNLSRFPFGVIGRWLEWLVAPPPASRPRRGGFHPISAEARPCAWSLRAPNKMNF